MKKHVSFSLEEIKQAAKDGRILSMEIEFSLLCNYRCPYCYVTSNGVPGNELSRDEIHSVLEQARDLGAQKIVILGGEPLMFPEIFETIDFINSLGMAVELFSNGALITLECAEHLFRAGVGVVVKLNSFDPKVQEELTGVKKALPKALQAIKHLQQAGYPTAERPLAVSSVLTTLNIEEAPTLWRWLRERHIEPYFEIITPQGKAMDNKHLMPAPERLKEIFYEVAEIDAEYGNIWEPQPPLIGERCMRHIYSCLVTSTGKVFPCVGIPEAIGDIRKNSLRDILRDSELVTNLKNHLNLIKGPCGSCEKKEECYGCRGAAYQLTGDYLASDPLCWRNSDKQPEIDFLPMDATNLVPHKPPALLVDRLLSQGERSGVVEVVVKPDCPWLTEDDMLGKPAYIEIASQAMAVIDSFMFRNQVRGGMLVGVKKFRFYGDASVGDTLTVEIFKNAQLGAIGIIDVKIMDNDKLIAEGELKIWQDDQQERLL
jgi:radical SAM protein with 4Fe4S-binding SPASM domain